MSNYTPLTQRFTQTYPATTLYWHTCKFTGKAFCSPIRRVTYSAEGLRLKREYDEAIKSAAKQVCKVYFYQCPITDRWFTTQKQSSRYSPESKSITHGKVLEYARQHRRRPEVRQKDVERCRRNRRKRKLASQTGEGVVNP